MNKIGIILAGGGSARFGGQDKGQILFNNRRLFDLVLERLQPQVDHIFIGGPHDYGTGLDVIPDLPAGPRGPAASLFAVTQKLPDARGFLTAPVDGPFFPEDLYEALSRFRSAIACGPERAHPTFAYWNIEDLKALFVDDIQNPALTKVAEHLGAEHVTFKSEDYFANFNSPSDLKNHVSRLQTP